MGLALKTSLAEMEKPVNVTVVGSATIGGQEVVHAAVPAEDKMQAFLWRHLLPAEDSAGPGLQSSLPAASRSHSPIDPR